MLPKGYRWIAYPHCGFLMQVIRRDTVLRNFPGDCKKCITESLITIEPKRQVVNS